MIPTILAILAVSAIGAGLAALLVVAERFIANYGECEININEAEKKFVTQGGKNLLAALNEQKLFIPSACGGRGTCGYCKLKILEGGGQVAPTETPFLTEKELKENVRLSCQVKIRESMKIFIPPELLAVKEYECVCTDIQDLTYDTKQFRLELKNPETIDFIPGQYIQLFTPEYKGNEEVYRAYSISSDPSDKHNIELIIRLVPNGICTTYCFEYLKKGDTVRMNGPYGEFRLSQTDAPIVFIAGGSGMAPIKCILHDMKNNNNERKAVYYFGGNKVKDLYLADLMKEFEQSLPNFKYVPIVAKPDESENWDGEKGLVTEAVQRNEEDLSSKEGYLCGSPGMIDASIKVLKHLGMTEEKIYYDKFE